MGKQKKIPIELDKKMMSLDDIPFLNTNNIKYEKVRSLGVTIITFLNKSGWRVQITVPDDSDVFTVNKFIQEDFDSDKITDLIDVL